MAMPYTLEGIGIDPNPDFSRLLKVLRHDGCPDRIPVYELFIDTEMIQLLLDKPVPDCVSTIEFYYRAGYDYVPVWPVIQMHTGDLTDARQPFPIRDRPGFEQYPWPILTDQNFSNFELVPNFLPDGMMMIGQIGGVFERVQMLCGYANLCYLLADDRILVHEIFNKVGALWAEIYQRMVQYDRIGAVVISDDLGFKTQTLISIHDIKEFLIPWYQRLVQMAHQAQKPCILHSCGNLSEIMPYLIKDVGIDAKHSFEDSILPVTEAKKIYGSQIALLGGYDLHKLCSDQEADIRKHTQMLMQVCGSKGGYAIGSGNSIAKYVPKEKYLTMLDESWKQ